MRFKRLKRRTEIKKGQLDIAPLIDVVFLLLIFFMLTSNFVLQPGIKVSLPKAVTGETLASENLLITLTGQDLLYINDKPATIQELIPQIRDAAVQRKQVLLRSDSRASLGRVVEIWDLCREAGVAQINIATNQKNPVA
jgi:biopolymer transport protein ExbD